MVRRPSVGATALAMSFAVNGIAFPSLLPRYPQLADGVGASEATFGLALVGAGVGGLLGGVLAPRLARRHGVVQVVRVGGLTLAVSLVVVGLAPTVPLLAVALLVVGTADALQDISMNEAALRAQQRRAGSIMGRLHGVWSLGSTAGGAIGALLAGLQVPVATHMAGVAVVAVVAQLWAAARLPEHPTTARGPAGASGPRRRLRVMASPAMALVTVAVVAAMVAEMTPLEWSALLLRRDLGTGPGVAGLAPVVFSAGILVGRSVTDPLVDRLGAARLLTLANLTAAGAIGLGLVGAAGTGAAWPLLVGLAIGGAGVSADFPMMFGAGDVIAMRLDLPAGTGTSVVGTLPRIAGLALPAFIGLVAEGLGLLVAVGISVPAALAAAWLLPNLVAAREAE